MVLFGIVVILICMWGLKEKVSELIQRVKDCYLFWLLLCLFILFISALFAIFKYTYSGPFQIDNESAMYFLSALVQSQAAILAIVITLTLIAVQIASSHYSPRVIDIFKKDLAIWWFLCYYGFSIFFGLCILMMMQVIQNENPCILAVSNCYSYHISLEGWICAAYWIAISAFVVLFLYIKKVLDLLNPSKIIKELSENIPKENVLKHIESVKENKKDRTKPIEEDSIQPIMDIIHSSVMKYDIATTRIGLGSVTDWVIEIIDLDGEGVDDISRHVCDRFERVGRLTVNKTDGEATAEVIKNWGDVLKEMAGEKRDLIAHTDIIDFELFVMSVAKEGFMHATSCAAASFGEITKIVIDAEKDYLTLTSSLCALGKLGILAAEKDWVGVVLGVHGSLLQIGTTLTGGSIRYKNKFCRETACYCAQLEIFLEKVDIKYTPLIKPEDQESFNEFKKLCKHELNKLRTQNPD